MQSHAEFLLLLFVERNTGGVRCLLRHHGLLRSAPMMQERWGLPVTTMRAAQLVLGVGVLAMIVVAWFHGEKGQQRATASEIAILTILIVLAGLLLIAVL